MTQQQIDKYVPLMKTEVLMNIVVYMIMLHIIKGDFVQLETLYKRLLFRYEIDLDKMPDFEMYFHYLISNGTLELHVLDDGFMHFKLNSLFNTKEVLNTYTRVLMRQEKESLI